MVVSILTVIGIMGVSFLFSMFLETQASKQFVATMQARYLAEAGVAHARTLLEEDRLGSRIDELGEAWYASWVGDEVDIDGDGTNEGKWLPFANAEEETIGRYGALVRDEAGKINLNTAVADPTASGVDAPSLSTLLTLAGISNGSQLASEIEEYRYGPDGRPGTASVDDDRDGTVDEADEYQVLALRGDDVAFEGLEELRTLSGVDETVLKRLAPLLTVYSTDQNLTLDGKPRVNVNTATASEILNVLLEVGADNPWQMAANMADYVDPDFDISHVTKTASESSITNLGDLGDWHWQTDTPSYYRTDAADGQPLVWNATLPVGRFYVLVHGVPGQKVGEVEFAGQTKESVDSGESLGLLDILGPTTVTMTCHEPIGTSCSFRSLELVASLDDSGLTSSTVRGVEPVRFHELMVEPKIELTVQNATFDGQTSGWICPSSGSTCYNSDGGQGRWTWQNPSVAPGQYYVWVYGSQEGQTVGEVRLSSQTELLTHSQRHPATITVGDDQKITLTIGKTAASGTYYFYKAVLSLQPDAEYVELINLSDKDLDISGWIIEGDAVGGRQARLPGGSIIKAHGLLVAAVDLEDDQAGLAGNGIDVQDAWELEDTVSAVQLEFPQGDLTPDSDWLSTAVPDMSRARLVLRYGAQIVDEVEYRLPLETTAPFQSLERGDPSIVRDTDHDGLDDDWYPSLKLYTPGAPNDNEGVRELKGLEQIVHNPLEEITVLNRPLESLGELAGLPSGVAWTVVSAQDLARLVDRLTVQGLRLETEDHLTAGESGWRETLEGYESHQQGALGTWQWLDVPDGQYTLSVYGWSGEQVSLRWQQADESYTEWIPTRSTDAQGRIVVGQIGVGGEHSPAKTLTLQARCDSTDGVCHLDHVILDPQLTLVGMVNINTASEAVLNSLPGMTEAIAQRLVAGRPYGDQEHKARGIGDLLAGSVLGETDEEKLEHFRSLARAITVRSHVFEILSVGEVIERSKPTASQRIRAIVER